MRVCVMTAVIVREGPNGDKLHIESVIGKTLSACKQKAKRKRDVEPSCQRAIGLARRRSEHATAPSWLPVTKDNMVPARGVLGGRR